jgi:hypothetical protein
MFKKILTLTLLSLSVSLTASDERAVTPLHKGDRLIIKGLPIGKLKVIRRESDNSRNPYFYALAIGGYQTENDKKTVTITFNTSTKRTIEVDPSTKVTIHSDGRTWPVALGITDDGQEDDDTATGAAPTRSCIIS